MKTADSTLLQCKASSASELYLLRELAINNSNHTTKELYDLKNVTRKGVCRLLSLIVTCV